MKKILALVLVVLAVSVQAQRKVGDILSDGIMNYAIISLDPAQVEVTKSPFAEGDIVIPQEIKDYDIVYKVTKIGSEAFSPAPSDENPNITSVVIPEGIEEIGWQAFLGCTHVKRYDLPSTLKKVGNAAFYCYNDKPSRLEEVHIAAVMPPVCGEMVWGSRFNAHDGNDRNIPLWVPKGTVLTYRAEKQWDYFNIITDGEETSTVEEIPYDPTDPDDQAVENVLVGEKAHKVFIDGQLRIVRGGKVFDVTGKQL